MVCLHCNEPILDSQKKMLAFDVPYKNVYLHSDCLKAILPELEQYIRENAEKIQNYTIEKGKITRK